MRLDGGRQRAGGRRDRPPRRPRAVTVGADRTRSLPSTTCTSVSTSPPSSRGVHEERRGHVRETTSMSDRPELKLGAFFFGGVEMDDAGAGAPAPMDRRYSNEACWKATLDYVELGQGGRTARLRLVLDDRAPLPVRGLRGDPERAADLDVDRRADHDAAARVDVQRRAAVEPAAPRRGLRHAAQPVGRSGDPRRRSWHGAPRGAAPQRQGRVDRIAGQPGPGRRRRCSTARCSRSRWRSSAAR